MKSNISNKEEKVETSIEDVAFIKAIFIRYKEKIDWKSICAKYYLSEDFIRDFKDQVDWVTISACQELSEDFIREFQNKINWNEISRHQELSEDFIVEFQDKVNWEEISGFQNLSEKFIIKYLRNINRFYILNNDKLDIKIKNRIYNFLKNDS